MSSVAGFFGDPDPGDVWVFVAVHNEFADFVGVCITSDVSEGPSVTAKKIQAVVFVVIPSVGLDCFLDVYGDGHGRLPHFHGRMENEYINYYTQVNVTVNKEKSF